MYITDYIYIYIGGDSQNNIAFNPISSSTYLPGCKESKVLTLLIIFATILVHLTGTTWHLCSHGDHLLSHV